MRSPADRLRLERALRVIGLAALVAWILVALRPAWGRTERASGGAIASSLERWTRSDAIASAAVTFDTVPDATHIAWLGALERAGVPVHWSGAREPLAVEGFPAADPAGGQVVLMSAGGARRRVLSDALGPIDTVESGSARLAAVEGELTIESAKQRARIAPAPAVHIGRVFVAGTADWESKFVIAALEESGWLVSARLAVGPGQDVTQGNVSGAPDTSRYAAVILMDSAAAERTRGVERFVRSGGGLVLVGDATRASSVAMVATWRSLAREVAPLGTSAEDSAWRGMSRFAFAPVADRALVLERRGAGATLVARRHYAGRVLGVGYDQSWRWRMTGGDRAVAAHRQWWSGLVSSVALRPATLGSAGAAPLARLHEALGDPSLPTVTPDWLGWNVLARLLGVLALATLVAEWWLRRARGGA